MDINFIRQKVFETVNFSFEKDIEFTSFDGVKVFFDGKCAKVGGNSITNISRGLLLLAMHISEGKTEIDIEEKKHFENLTFFLDCSRNGVMKVDAVKKYINILSSLGFDSLMLYTEDTYEIEGRPLFGYLRGRYTQSEIEEMVSYGETMGVELIPCIQTLGHLQQYLKWADSGGPDYTGEKILSIRNTREDVFCGEEETYKFIEDEIKACRKAYKTNKIHIGMDESFGFSKGKYMAKHGLCNSYDVIKQHLDRVVKICEKYDFKPMIWSDMFFRLGSGGAYYKYDFEFPKGIKETIPDVELCYWDYYSDDQSRYENMMKKHYELSDNIAFAGSVCGPNEFLPKFDYVCNNSKAGLRAALRHNIKNVICTSWGDDGNETNAFLFLPLLSLYSEHCFKGENCTESDIEKVAEFLTKMKYRDFKKMCSFTFIKPDPYLEEWRAKNGGGTDLFWGKRLFYTDILYDMSIRYESCDEIIEKYEDCAKRMEELIKLDYKNKDDLRYAYLLYKIGSIKAELVKKLRASYKAGDILYLKKVADEILPQLKGYYKEFKVIHKKQWMDVYKPFGYEVLSFRFGGVISRVDDALETIKSYLEGEIPKIAELEEETVINEESHPTVVKKLISPSGTI